MSSPRLLLVIDWKLSDKGFSFLDSLKEMGYQCDVLDMDVSMKYKHPVGKMYSLWSRFFILGWRTFKLRNHYDTILAWQSFAGLFYSSLLRFFSKEGAKSILVMFFYNEKASWLNRALRYHFIQYALKNVSYAFCFSQKEAALYNQLFRCEYHKFVSCHFGVKTDKPNVARSLLYKPEGYVFSSGISNRDYATLFKSVENLDVRIVVVAKKHNLANLKIPDNVTVYFDLYGEEYNQLFWKSDMVVIPLNDERLSSGLSVLFDAMLYKKPVIITRTWATEDHLTDMHDAVLVPPNDYVEMRRQILYVLNNPAQAEKLKQNAFITVSEKYNMKHYAREVASLIT